MIDTSQAPSLLLQEYDAMMVGVAVSCERRPVLAMLIWSEALRELERRGQAKLISGTFDDLGKARIRRLYFN